MSSSYKLIYFDFRGLGEALRQLLFLADQPFEDVRYTYEEWPKHKKDTPFGQLPVLEVNGKPLAQSFAIARFLARKYGFTGTNDFEAAWVDAIGDQFKDYFAVVRPHIGVVAGVRKDSPETTRPAAEAARLKIYPFLEKRLSESESGFLVGDRLTWIDLFLADHVDMLRGIIPGFLDEYPKVLAHFAKVRSEPRLRAFLDKRPVRKF